MRMTREGKTGETERRMTREGKRGKTGETK